MIKIVLPDFPDAHDVDGAAVADVFHGSDFTDLTFYTEITTDGAGLFDIDVYTEAGIWRVRIPKLSLEGVTREEAIDILFDADNGGADEFLRALNVRHEVLTAAWERHHAKHATRTHGA